MDRQSPYLCTERIYLRPMELEDIDLYHDMVNDARLGKVAGFNYPNTKANYRQWFEKMTSEGYGETTFFFAACRWEDDAVVGFAALWHIDRWIGQAEFSICLSKVEYLDQGYGTEITQTILDFGFGTVGLQRIYLTCSAEDPRPRHCYEKAGFVQEGRLRHTHRLNGRLIDSLIMSVLVEEWQARRSEPARVLAA